MQINSLLHTNDLFCVLIHENYEFHNELRAVHMSRTSPANRADSVSHENLYFPTT